MKQREKTEELQRMNRQELQAFLAEKKEALRRLRFDLASGKVKNVREIRGTRKDIARILTRLKTLEAEKVEKS